MRLSPAKEMKEMTRICSRLKRAGTAGLVVSLSLVTLTACSNAKGFLDGEQKTRSEQVTLVHRERLEKARNAISKNPRSAYWHNQAALSLAAMRDLPSAIKEIEEAIRLDPCNPFHHYSSASLREQSGDQAGREKALREAIRLDSLNPVTHFSLAVALESKGEYQQAFEEYKLTVQNLAHADKDEDYWDPRDNAYSVRGLRSMAQDKVKQLESKLQ
jgi:tetratricopeptide (TPR) repeat protein